MKYSNNEFIKIYQEIINEGKSPVSFTPETLLNDAVSRCYSTINKYGNYHIYTLKEILNICDEDLPFKPLFNEYMKQLKYKNDFSILVFYFKKYEYISEILHSRGYIHPEYKIIFSDEEMFSQIDSYFKKSKNTACNFNSIDTCPQLGCAIGINGEKVHNYLEFEKELDHELNHYFERNGMLIDKNIKIKDDKNISERVINVILKFYDIEKNKSNEAAIQNIKVHFFNDIEFRSMCSNVYHDIIKYNMNHINELSYMQFIKMVKDENNFDSVNSDLRDAVIFSWTVRIISTERWNILNNTIKDAFNEHSNIFRKAFMKTKDWFRNLIA